MLKSHQIFCKHNWEIITKAHFADVIIHKLNEAKEIQRCTKCDLHRGRY